MAVAFPSKLLNDNEEVVLDLRPHWIYMVQPVLAILGAIILVAVLIVVNSGGKKGGLQTGTEASATSSAAVSSLCRPAASMKSCSGSSVPPDAATGPVFGASSARTTTSRSSSAVFSA